jgi:hypothetical protein
MVMDRDFTEMSQIWQSKKIPISTMHIRRLFVNLGNLDNSWAVSIVLRTLGESIN